MFNHSIIIGRLTANPQMRIDQNGMNYVRVKVAVNEPGSQRTEFIDCIFFNAIAELIVKNAVKGTQILISGKLKTKSITIENKVYTQTALVASKVRFIGKRLKPCQEEQEESAE